MTSYVLADIRNVLEKGPNSTGMCKECDESERSKVDISSLVSAYPSEK